MPLSKGTTYDNVYYDFLLNPLKNIFKDEFVSSAVYISPDYKNQGNFEVKLWGSLATTEALRQQAWTKNYSVTIDIYLKEVNPKENFYELFYSRAERAYEVLFNNITKSTTIGSGTKTWVNGEVSEMIINSLEEEEDQVDGLHKVTLDFSCIIERD